MTSDPGQPRDVKLIVALMRRAIDHQMPPPHLTARVDAEARRLVEQLQRDLERYADETQRLHASGRPLVVIW